MKRLILLFITITTLFTLTSCGYDVQTKKRATKDELLAFLENKIVPLEETSSSFTYEYESNYKSVSSTSKKTEQIKYEVYGTIDEEFTGEFYYKGTSKSKTISSTLDGKEKTKVNIKEKGSVFLKAESKNDLYVSVKSKIKIPYGNIKQKTILTMLDTDTNLYRRVVSQLGTFKTLVDSIASYSNFDAFFYYIDGDKLKVVSSTYSEHVEIVYVFEGNKLVKYLYTSVSSEGNVKAELIFKKVKNVKVPTNLDDYRK